MILFKPEHVEPILAGKKTQTRRTGKRRWRVGAIHQCRVAMFDEPFARVRILDVRREPLQDITAVDASAEGYESVADYRRAFANIYGFWDPLEWVWVVDFKLVEAGVG